MTLDQIRQKVYLLTSTNATSFPDAQLVVLANTSLDRVVSLIMQSDGRWQWDDENNTDLPITTTTLTTSQQDYTLATTQLQVTRVEVKDSSGTWHKLVPMDQADLATRSLTDWQSSPGLPNWYDKIGNSFFLYPAPNYTQAASLKVYFKRGPSYFATSDTTKAPGINTLYHDLIPLWIAYEFALGNGKGNANGIYAQIQLKEDALREDYSLRDKDDHVRLRTRNWRFN